MNSDPEGSYLYAVVARSVALPSLTGFGPVRGIAHGDLKALVSTVPRERWQPESLASREAVEAVAACHQEVLQQVLEHCTPVPMRLGTILRGDDKVRELLRRAESQLTAAVDGLQGRLEWGIKLALDRGVLTARVQDGNAELRSLQGRIDAAPEGTRFMLAKRRDRLVARLVDEEGRRLAASVREALADLAERSVALAPRADCAINDSLLVATAETDRLGARVAAAGEDLADAGTIELTGPWPPYSFAPVVQLDEERQEPANG